jgi:four helix bundle protein
MGKESVILTKYYQFGLRIVKLHLHLSRELKQFEISSQLLRSGTSIGANVEEASGGSSKRDFINRMNIAYKEARESKYWLRLLKDSQIIETNLAESLLNDCEELLKILFSIINTSRKG